MYKRLIFVVFAAGLLLNFNTIVKADSVGEEDLHDDVHLKKDAVVLKALPNKYKVRDFCKKFKVIKTEKDSLEFTHYTLELQNQGYSTDDEEIKVHVSSDNKIIYINGDLQQGEIEISNEIKITEKTAIEKAFEAIGQSQDNVISYSGNVIKQKEILINSRTNRLVYQVEIIFSEPEVANWIIQIDAETGAVLKKQNILSNACVEKMPQNFKVINKDKNRSINRPLHVEKKDNLFYLIDTTHQGTIKTFNLDHQLDPSFGKLVCSTTNTFAALEYSSAVDAHYYAGEVYDYYKNIHQLESLDGRGGDINSFVNYGVDCNNAYWDGEVIIFGDGDKKNYKPFSGAKDIVAHELTHAVIQYSAKLDYQGQSGALNESFADIFGYFIAPNNWLIGEDVCVRGVKDEMVRSIKEPDKYNQAAHMDEYASLSITEDDDWGGIHYNSGIPNKAAYNTIVKIGKEKAERVYFRALFYYLTSQSQFIDAKNALQQSGKDLYGEKIAEKIAEAWLDVGIA